MTAATDWVSWPVVAAYLSNGRLCGVRSGDVRVPSIVTAGTTQRTAPSIAPTQLERGDGFAFPATRVATPVEVDS